MLDELLAKLNAAVVEFNKKVDECIENGQHTEITAAGLRWHEQITAKVVHDCEEWNGWPKALLNIVDEIYVSENAKVIIRLAKSVKSPTQITEDLRIGSANSKGGTNADWAEPVPVKLIQLAHLFARAEAGKDEGHNLARNVVAPKQATGVRVADGNVPGNS